MIYKEILGNTVGRSVLFLALAIKMLLRYVSGDVKHVSGCMSLEFRRESWAGYRSMSNLPSRDGI